MLIVVSAVASAVALLGALLVGYSTKNTIAHMVPTRDPNSVLVAFPADVEQEIKQQSMVSTGVAVIQPAEGQTPEQLASTLRDSLGRAGTSLTQVAGQTPAPGDPKEMQLLAGKLESLLLDDGQKTEDVRALKDYALRELSAQDGSIELPNYDVSNLNLDSLGLNGELMARVSDLQGKLNEQIAALPELQGRQINLKDVQLGTDPKQLAAAIDALGMQSDMLGIEFGSDARYDTLQDLGEELLRNNDGSQANLDGLDLSELESISRELLAQLNQSAGPQSGNEPEAHSDADFD
jgi:hypothetical protein